MDKYMDKKTISIVLPCFNEEGNVEEITTEIKKLFDNK